MGDNMALYKWYVGVAKDTNASYRFRSLKTPTKRSHGRLYKFITGPFRNEKEAVDFQTYSRT